MGETSVVGVRGEMVRRTLLNKRKPGGAAFVFGEHLVHVV